MVEWVDSGAHALGPPALLFTKGIVVSYNYFGLRNFFSVIFALHHKHMDYCSHCALYRTLAFKFKYKIK